MRMRKRRGAYNNECERCRCPLDAGEGRYCEDCLEQMELEEQIAEEFDLTLQQARNLNQRGTIAV